MYIATLTVNKTSVEDGVEDIKVVIVEDVPDDRIVVDAGETVKTYDITVTGLKPGNTELVDVELYIGEGLNIAHFYHNETEIFDYVYNAGTNGKIKFATATFSPFTVVYDANSTYVPGTVPADLPVANVTKYVPTEDIVWGDYDQWSPTEGIEAKLDAIYQFSCTETVEQVEDSKYANWYCDFYVKLDKDLGENEIFLGGNYGTFGWVGFHNGEMTLEANTELGLLESVTTNPWTYLEVVDYVGSFICGVGNVGDSLEGATFTVMLRLTNPENEAEFYNVATITYTWNSGN